MPLAALLRMVSYCPVAGHGGWKTSTHSPHPMSAQRCQHHQQAQNAGTIPQTKMCQHQGRNRRKHWNPTTPPEECPSHKKGKREGQWQRPLKNPTIRPSLRSQQSCGWPGGPISRPTSPTFSSRSLMTSPAHFDKWLPPLTSWAMRSMRCRRTGVAGGISGATNWFHQVLLERHPLLQGHSTQWVAEDNGLRGYPLTWGPVMAGKPNLLPMVWERRPKWRYGGKSPADHALPPGPCLCPSVCNWLIHN